MRLTSVGEIDGSRDGSVKISGGSEPIVGVNGEALVAGTTYAGSNGGLLIVNPDGTVDFSANSDFDYLSGTETAQTEFTYEIQGGASATLDVQVLAFDGGGGGIDFL